MKLMGIPSLTGKGQPGREIKIPVSSRESSQECARLLMRIGGGDSCGVYTKR